MLKVEIIGPPRSGKIAVAQRINNALRVAGMQPIVRNDGGDFQYYRPDATLIGKNVDIVVRLPVKDNEGEMQAHYAAESFVRFCATRNFGIAGWPDGSFAMLVGLIREGKIK